MKKSNAFVELSNEGELLKVIMDSSSWHVFSNAVTEIQNHIIVGGKMSDYFLNNKKNICINKHNTRLAYLYFEYALKQKIRFSEEDEKLLFGLTNFQFYCVRDYVKKIVKGRLPKECEKVDFDYIKILLSMNINCDDLLTQNSMIVLRLAHSKLFKGVSDEVHNSMIAKSLAKDVYAVKYFKLIKKKNKEIIKILNRFDKKKTIEQILLELR